MDNLKVGSLVSEKWLEKTSVIQSPSLGLLYNFVWRFDKTAQDEGVFNMGATDASNVYQLVRPNHDYSGAAITMDIEHAKIHCGYHFFNASVFTLGAGATLNIVIETYDRRPHMLFTATSTDAGYTFTTREDVSANADGTLIPIFNNNRDHVNGNTVIIRSNPTGINTVGSTVIREGRVGTGGGVGNAVGGNTNRGNEVIMKANTKYLLTITNLGNITNYINLVHEWYEIAY